MFWDQKCQKFPAARATNDKNKEKTLIFDFCSAKIVKSQKKSTYDLDEKKTLIGSQRNPKLKFSEFCRSMGIARRCSVYLNFGETGTIPAETTAALPPLSQNRLFLAVVQLF